MSRKVPEETYSKTFSYRFRQWLDGTKDPFLDQVEMKKQKPLAESEEARKRREQDSKALEAKVYDLEHNFEMRIFNRVYRVFSTGAVNIVTGMILDYRAFDTLGESHVLFIATCTVLILLRRDDKKEQEEGQDNDRLYEPKNDVILQTVARVLVPPILLFGIYIILAGHLGPGGGFSGGAVIGAGLILYLNAFGFAKTERFFTAKTYRRMSFCALACYSIAKSYSFYTGANHIESVVPLGTPGAILSGGLILVLNICVGVGVAGTMYTFYVMFRKGGY